MTWRREVTAAQDVPFGTADANPVTRDVVRGLRGLGGGVVAVRLP